MRKKHFLLAMTFILCSFATYFGYQALQPPKYYLCVCAIFRNEARFLREWIEYHAMMGVDHFYLFNNLSQDHYQQILQPYIDQGLVDLMDWPYQGNNQKEWNEIQCSAYNQILKTKGKDTFWLAVIDTDEFIVPLKKPNLPAFLKNYEDCSGIGINWQLYGTSNVQRIPPDKTLIGSLLRKAKTDADNNRYVKSIFRPKRVKKLEYPHHGNYKKPYFHVTENKVRFSNQSLTPTVSVNKIRINHYTLRDEDFFYKEKLERLVAWYPGCAQEPDPRLNVEEDKVILRFVPELERRLKGCNSLCR